MQNGEGIATHAPTQTSTPHKCEWSNCKGQHAEKPNYPNNGKITKGGYREAWIGAGMQPWDLYGKIRKRLRKNGKSYKTMTYEYETQAHHLVPTSLVNETATLKANLTLIGYDCDDPHNGMMLPKHKMDIPLHDLQAHEGQHPGKYMGPIKKELSKVQEDFDGICNFDLSGEITIQIFLLAEMEFLASKARQKILNIRRGTGFWPVRDNAKTERAEALAEYSRREKLHQDNE